MSFDAIEKSGSGGRPVEFYKFTIGEEVWRYTSAPRGLTLDTGDAEIDGVYLPAAIDMTEPEHAKEIASTRITLNAPRDFPIALLFRSALPDFRARVNVFRKHLTDPDEEVVNWWSGSLISCDFSESAAKILAEPRMGKLARSGLRMRWGFMCQLQTYSGRCGLDPADYSSDVTVSAIDGEELTVSGMPANPDGYYNGGYAVAPDGSRRFIVSHVGSDLTLILPFNTLETGDTLTIVAGDDHQHTTCREKFTVGKPAGRGNIDRFLGVFTTPGRNPFTQGGLTRPGGGGGIYQAIADQYKGGD